MSRELVKLLVACLLVLSCMSCSVEDKEADEATTGETDESDDEETEDKKVKTVACKGGLRVIFSNIISPRRRRLTPNPIGRLYICASDNSSCTNVPKSHQEGIGLRRRKTAFTAYFFVKSGITITRGDYIKISLRDKRFRIFGFGFRDLPIGSKTIPVPFEESKFIVTHQNFSAKIDCLNPD